MSSPTYQVGIIGYGLSAKIFHIPFINDSKDFNLHAIVQRSPTTSSNAGTDHPNVKLYSSSDDLIADASVNIIVITTPPNTHFSLASSAIKAGKHVLVEKPFTSTSDEAYQLVKLAEQHNVILTVYQNRRYDSDFLTLKSLLRKEALGRVVDFESHFDRHRPEMPATQTWKTDPASYSAVWDLGTHLMDQVVSLYGLPQRITGFVGSQRHDAPEGLEDSFLAHLHYSGVTATVRASVVSPEKNQLRFWVRGTKGSFKKFHLDPQEDQLKTGMRPGQNKYGVEDESRWGVLTTSSGDAFVEERVETKFDRGYTAFYDDFAKALGAGEKPVVDGKTAADVIRLCELMRESSKKGQTLSFDGQT